VEVVPGPGSQECRTPLSGVVRLRHGLTARTRRTAAGWISDTADEPDPLLGYRSPRLTDVLAAGEAQIEALTTEIQRIHAAEPGGTSYATLLSGGIDSGTVTYLAATAGLPVSPYSVATPWGDELSDAAELCAELGIDLSPVHLTEDEIVASIPEAIRWLGSRNPRSSRSL
jgi:asparagine synthetase B (glutamine-hydrolysing)